MNGDAQATLDALAASWLRLQIALGETKDAQWSMGSTPQLPEDTTERSKGVTSDPTPTITDDERRKKLRAAVLEAEAAQLYAERVIRASANVLEKALREESLEAI